MLIALLLEWKKPSPGLEWAVAQQEFPAFISQWDGNYRSLSVSFKVQGANSSSVPLNEKYCTTVHGAKQASLRPKVLHIYKLIRYDTDPKFRVRRICWGYKGIWCILGETELFISLQAKFTQLSFHPCHRK